MPIISQNPATLHIYNEYEPISQEQLVTKIQSAAATYRTWSKTTVNERMKLMDSFQQLLREKRDYLAQLITDEMGCPLAQTKSEIEKCAFMASTYCEQAEEYLQPTMTQLGAQESYISYEPLGVILHIAPWNYPFYLALRPTMAAILAGNSVVMKHASNVPQCALTLEALFLEAGFPSGVFQTLLINSSQVESIIEMDEIVMVTLIGSEAAGSQVAQTAGKHLKKSIMELGGSDPFIVLEDADIERAVQGAIPSRLRNQGQSCNAAKRFIIMEDVAEEFISKLKIEFEKEVIGDPNQSGVTQGPLGQASGLRDIVRQVDESVAMGAHIITGGILPKLDDNLKGYYYKPTILTQINKNMPVYNEEIFGPVAPIIVVQSHEEAIKVANDTRFGLGASIWSHNVELAVSMIPKIEAGNVYINSVVRGNPKSPFGGVKKTGYGREFGEAGMREFVNIKTVVIG